MLVMANDAKAVGTVRRDPRTTPSVLARAQVVSHRRLTAVACDTLHSPELKRPKFTANDSSVTVAPNKKERGLGVSWQKRESEAPYNSWRVFTNVTEAMIASAGDPASHILGIMY